MKNAKCNLSNIALCAMAVSALGLLTMSSLLIAAGAKKHCKDNSDCSEEDQQVEE